MLVDALKPMKLTHVASELGLDPLTTVRLLVAMGAMPSDVLQFDSDIVARLREFGRIDEPWWDGLETSNDLRADVMVLLSTLLERGWIGSRATPLHNALRGLADQRALALRDAVDVLAEVGVLVVSACPIGQLISVSQEQLSLARRVARGETELDGLTQLFEEYSVS